MADAITFIILMHNDYQFSVQNLQYSYSVSSDYLELTQQVTTVYSISEYWQVVEMPWPIIKIVLIK